jgi:hypothetical protein
MKRRLFALAFLAAAALLAQASARAEPYLAVRTGLKCAVCHVNPTGGGKRTEFGAIYSQTEFAAGRLDPETGKVTEGTEPAPWTGKINNHISLGADLRANATATIIPHATDTYAFDPVRAQTYLEVQPIVNRLTIYLDEQVSPGAAINRETYALLYNGDKTLYVKAGRMFLPFGLRIEDDTAFVRAQTSTSYASYDDGVETGLSMGSWEAQLAITNGAGGGTETNRGKQFTGTVNFVQPLWRIGVSASANYNDGQDRRMQAVFGGLRTGFVSWLAEAVNIVDEGTPTGRVSQTATLAEANLELARGHNLRLTYEWLDPNRDVAEDQRERYSVVYEYSPFQFTQFRLGARKNRGVPQDDTQNTTEVFLQWHAFF